MGNRQAQQKCPCNFTLGFYSMSPQFVVTIRNNKIETNVDVLTYLLNSLTFPGFRLILEDMGEFTDQKVYSSFDDGEIEFFPFFRVMAYTSSVHEISPVAVGSPIKMVSFSPRVEYVATDWTSILYIIDSSVWIGFFIISLMISIVLSCGVKENHRQTIRTNLFKVANKFWSTIATSANQTSITRGPRILLLCFSLFIFFLWALFNGNVNTDLIVGEEPFRIDSMEDVLKPETSELQPKWRKEFNLHKSFEYSDPNSVRGKIWRKAIAKGMDEALILGEDSTSTFEILSKYRKTVFFDSENFVQAFALYSCHWGLKKGDFHISTGDAGEELLVFPLKFQNDSCYSLKRQKIPKIFLNFFETGQFGMYFGPRNFLVHSVRNPVAGFQCPILEKKAAKGMEFNQVSIDNIPLLLRLYLFCLCICLFVFIVELCFSRLTNLRMSQKVDDLTINGSPPTDPDELSATAFSEDYFVFSNPQIIERPQTC